MKICAYLRVGCQSADSKVRNCTKKETKKIKQFIGIIVFFWQKDRKVVFLQCFLYVINVQNNME
jgi:hypothetical protein